MPTWEEYWGKGGINDQKVASGAGDGIGSNGKPLSNGGTTSSNSGSSYSGGSSSSSSGSSSSYTSPAKPQTNQQGQAQLPSWMGNMYQQVPGTNYYSTNPSNPNSAKYYADGSPVASIGFDYTQTGGNKFSGYGSKDQFDQIMNMQNSGSLSTPGGAKQLQDLMESWLSAGSLTSNDSIYSNYNNNIPTPQTSSTPPPGGVNHSSTYTPERQTGTMVATGAKAPSYNVNDKAFQDKSAEERLEIFRTNPTLAAQEVARAKQVWADNASDPARQAAAHAWADQVRAVAGLPADGAEDESSVGTGGGSINPSGGTGGGTNTGGGAGAGTGTGAIDWTNPNAVLGAIGQSLQGSLGAINNPNNPYWQQQKAASDLEQQNIYNSKVSQYQNLLNSLKTGQQNDLKAITESVDSATNTIEDKSFQDWLSARQGAANRGLAGSGIAREQDTRLLLSKQRDLANMFAEKNKSINDVNRRYTDQINTAQSSLANTNLNSMQAAAFQKLFADSQGSLSDQAKIFADLFGKLSGQNQTSQTDQLKIAADKYATDVKYKYLYDKMDNDTKLDTARLQLDWEKYGLDVTKVFGQDAQGRPTLDAQKMVAEIQQRAQQMAITAAHNAVVEKQGWARINQTDQDMQIKLQAMVNQTEQFKQRMHLDSSNASNAQLGRQVDTIKSIMTSEGENLRSLRTQLSSPNLSDSQKASLQAEYSKSLGKIEAAQNSMGEIYKFNTGESVNYSGEAPKPFNMNDMNYGDNYDSIG
jgi:hypothetical protein